MITAAAALAVLVAVAFYAGSSGKYAGLAEGVALAGAPVLAAALALRLPALVPWAVGVTGGGYAIGRAHRGGIDGWSAVVGGALLLAAELASWSIEHDERIEEDRVLLLRRIALVGGLAAVSMLLGLMLLGAAAVSAQAGILLSAVGLAAALGSVAVILRLLRG